MLFIGIRVSASSTAKVCSRRDVGTLIGAQRVPRSLWDSATTAISKDTLKTILGAHLPFAGSSHIATRRCRASRTLLSPLALAPATGWWCLLSLRWLVVSGRRRGSLSLTQTVFVHLRLSRSHSGLADWSIVRMGATWRSRKTQPQNTCRVLF